MVSHGLCSPGLFGLARYIYVVFGTRVLVLCSGVLRFMPVLSLCWFLMCSSNMAFPPRLRLLAEIWLIVCIVFFSLWLLVPVGFITFVVGVYSLILYRYIQHGAGGEGSFGGKLLRVNFLLMRFLLWVPLNALTLCGDLFSGWL